MKHGLPKIKDMEPGDFKNNDYLLRMAEKLNRDGAGIVLGTLDDLINWGRSNSLWSLTFGTSCCAIEFMALGAARYDMARFGFEVTRNSPRQADMIMVLGTITYRMAPVLKRLYDQMAEPKYVVAVGGMHHQRGAVPAELPRGERDRPHHPGGRVHSRMSAAAGSLFLRDDAVAT